MQDHRTRQHHVLRVSLRAIHAVLLLATLDGWNLPNRQILPAEPEERGVALGIPVLLPSRSVPFVPLRRRFSLRTRSPPGGWVMMMTTISPATYPPRIVLGVGVR